MSCNKNLSYLTKRVILVLSISGITLSPVFAGEEFKYNANSRRDPFIPLISETGGYASDAYEASAIEDIRLEGIVWDDVKGSIAIINGEIVKEGDYLGSVKILKINKDSVVFDVNGESLKIELNGD
ncbi:MAG: general secretion pathway protein GspB [Candidatus Omnitrophica bacterium]|nr:general secretion pathway protein GspB [Candidatus Omnitrophota bacterium]